MREACPRLSEFIKEWVFAGFIGAGALCGLIDQELGDEVDGIGRSGRAEDLGPEMRLYFGKVEIGE